MTSTLVLGNAPGDVSRHADTLLRPHDGVTRVGGSTDDLTRALMAARGPVLVDDVPGWLAGQLGNRVPLEPAAAQRQVDAQLDELVVALRALPFDVVVLSRETAPTVAHPEPAQTLLRDLLERVNRRLSAACRRVHVVAAGRVLDISGAPLVGR